MGAKTQVKKCTPQEHLFPVFLNLRDRLCVIAGGGKVAQRKAETLIRCGAKVKVVSPRAEQQVMQWASDGLLTYCKKKFAENDLVSAFMVFAATDSGKENKRVFDICRQKGILVNAVDEPDFCDFLVPSVVRRKSLAIAISTEGKSPLFAKKIRQELEAVITEEYGEFLDILGEKRRQIKESVPDRTQRSRIFEALVYSDLLELLKEGKQEKVKKRIEQCISSLQD